jgi:hypothetical protein
MWFQRVVEAVDIEADETIDNISLNGGGSVPSRKSRETAESLNDFQRVRLHIRDIEWAMRGHTTGIAPQNGFSEDGEPLYCICNRVSFGEMIACNGDNVSLSLSLLLETLCRPTRIV